MQQLVGASSATLQTLESMADQPIGGGVGAQRQRVSLPRNFTRDFNGLGNEIKYLIIHRLAVGGYQKKIECRTVLLSDHQHGRDAAADAIDGAGAVRFELAGVHHAEKTF